MVLHQARTLSVPGSGISALLRCPASASALGRALRLADRCAKNPSLHAPFCRCATSSPAPGEVIFGDGAFGMAAKFLAKVQNVRARQRLPPRGSWQNRQVLTEGVKGLLQKAASIFLTVTCDNL